jgi:hypothetical protein
MAKRVDRQVPFGTLPLGTVMPGPCAALWRGSSVWLPQMAALGCALRQEGRCVDPRPGLRLLVKRRPERQVVRHPASRCAGLDHIAQHVERLAHAVLPLSDGFGHQCQVRRGSAHSSSDTSES